MSESEVGLQYLSGNLPSLLRSGAVPYEPPEFTYEFLGFTSDGSMKYRWKANFRPAWEIQHFADSGETVPVTIIFLKDPRNLGEDKYPDTDHSVFALQDFVIDTRKDLELSGEIQVGGTAADLSISLYEGASKAVVLKLLTATTPTASSKVPITRRHYSQGWDMAILKKDFIQTQENTYKFYFEIAGVGPGEPKEILDGVRFYSGSESPTAARDYIVVLYDSQGWAVGQIEGTHSNDFVSESNAVAGYITTTGEAKHMRIFAPVQAQLGDI